jgi:hypothetical protein
MDLDKMIADITAEKSKLDKLTKKFAGHRESVITRTPSRTHKNNSPEAEAPSTSPSPPHQPTSALTEKDSTNKHMQNKLQLNTNDFQKVPKTTIIRILELLKNYVNMDKSFRLKHDSLKTLYNAYLDLYKKYKATGSVNTNTNANNGELIIAGEGAGEDVSKHESMLKNIHTEMRDNNSNLYRERLLILKKIREHPEIQKATKDKLCGRLIAIFKAPPIPEYKPLALLAKGSNEDPIYGDEKISVSELDHAYLQKHNELMTVFKAYQNLYKKVLNYKEQLEKYKKLPTGSSISRCEMEKMLKDQRFVMDMIDKMQDNLVSNKVLTDSEKVLVTPVASNPDNMNAFNDTMRNQIKHIIDRQVDINPSTKSKIENLLKQYQTCDSNDEFCKSGREILLLKKITK